MSKCENIQIKVAVLHAKAECLGSDLYQVSRQLGISGHNLKDELIAVFGDDARHSIYRVSYGMERVTIKLRD
jgi:hypothetical protein